MFDLYLAVKRKTHYNHEYLFINHSIIHQFITVIQQINITHSPHRYQSNFINVICNQGDSVESKYVNIFFPTKYTFFSKRNDR